ncbi:MAG: GntR family transcriptional regulator [Gammaproteobacteria bacterium]|nr:GntR family transcriptional regulator [Gammaproteobacteria bacterium]
MPNQITTGNSDPAEAATTRGVADWVRERIRLGRLVPGQRLVEADIVREAGASRSKVREALQRLEAEGLVTIEEFRGASVKRFSADEVRQLYQARMVLEGLAAAEFAASANAVLKQRLQALQQELDQWESEGDHDRFARLNDAWHKLIIEGSGNTYVAQFLVRLTVPIYRLLFATFYTSQRISSANADHRIITAAIIDGRVEDAELAMRAHINHGLAALTELKAHFDD